MAKDPVYCGLFVVPDSIGDVKKRGRPPHFTPQHEMQWVRLYQQGFSITKIAKQYQAGPSTVGRHLRLHIGLRDRTTASMVASTKFPKTPFSGDDCEGAYLAGLVEDFYVRKAGRLVEMSSTTTHPAMVQLFHKTFKGYGHPTTSPGYDPVHGYYQCHLQVSLDSSFEPFLRKSDVIPDWIPRHPDDPLFESYVSGLIAAEGCIRLYNNHGRADAVLHITLNKPVLLDELSRVLRGRLYEVQRAWRLVIYGKAAAEVLRRLSIHHEERVEKARLVVQHTGKRWSAVEPLWNKLVSDIRTEVNQYKRAARLEYIQRHGTPHPRENIGIGA